jgi:hypothetical protein
VNMDFLQVNNLKKNRSMTMIVHWFIFGGTIFGESLLWL